MSETGQLIELLRQQYTQRKQMESERKQMETLFETLAGKLTLEPTCKPPVVAIPSFVPFDSSSEIWSDYWARFLTFIGANIRFQTTGLLRYS